MRNAWRECQKELEEAESGWFDGDDHKKYFEWVHKWTGFVVLELKSTADEVDKAQRAYVEAKAINLPKIEAP